MEQTVGEIIDALSKFDRNTRVKLGHEIDLKYDGAACRLVNKRLDGLIETLKLVEDQLDDAADSISRCVAGAEGRFASPKHDHRR